MYRTPSERVGPEPPMGGNEIAERRRKKRGLQLSNLGAMVLEGIALGTEDLQSQPRAASQRRQASTREVVQSDFLVCSGGLCIPTNGPLRLEEHLGDHYILGRSSWERCHSAAHAEARLAQRIDGLDPHDLASEAVALFDTGIG
jgi:hypothetical protein